MRKQLPLAVSVFIAMFCVATSVVSAQGKKQKTIKSQQSTGGVVVSEILGYEYDNQKNTFSANVVGQESSAIEGSGQQTLIVIKLNRVPNVEYKYISRKLNVTALYEEAGKQDEIFERVELVVPHVEATLFVPLIIQRGATQTTIRAELYEDERLVSAKKQFLLAWAGD